MRITHIDWSSDAAWFLVAVFLICIIVSVLLERAAPSKKKKAPKRGVSSQRQSRDDLIF